MSVGRTVLKHTRVYMDGYDLSGYSRAIGPLSWEHDTPDLTTMTDGVQGALPNQAKLGIGALNGVFDNTAINGLHVLLGSPGVRRTVAIAVGMRAAPAQGDSCFVGQFEQKGYSLDTGSGAALVNVSFDVPSESNATLLYFKPWGTLLHANSAEVGVNAAIGVDDDLRAAATATGAVLMYQVLAGNGTATLKAQDAATNTDVSFADVSGLTSGSLNCAVVQHGIVAIANTATLRRYIRWQIVLGTATSVTFIVAVVRPN